MQTSLRNTAETALRKSAPSVRTILALAALVGGVSESEGQQSNRYLDGLRDNSFFIEEAYNQERGVVQHIATVLFQRHRDDNSSAWDIGFTQEWPLPDQKNQVSYTIPYTIAKTGSAARSGLADMTLSYRREAYFDERTLTAFAPAINLTLPTGDAAKGFGEDTWGPGITLPFSTTFAGRWFVHANAGATFLPRAKSADRRDLVHFNLGASLIYAATPECHFLIEWIGDWEEQFEPIRGRFHEFSSTIIPGVRKAFNFQGGSQLVAGIGLPVGLTRSAPEIGAFVYLSFEHSFLKNP